MLATHSSSRASCGIEEEYGFNREGEREKKEGRWGVVLTSMGFNRENVSMLKRKWLECWNISGELCVHYRNLNRAGANEGCVSQIVRCFYGRLMDLVTGHVGELSD